MRQTITVHPNKELFDKTRDIPKDQITGDTYRQIGSSMLQILKEKGGIGLSANQVGLPFNMCVLELVSSDPKMLLNPRVIKQSAAMIKSREGCLSLPGAEVIVSRHGTITVEYEDVTGETKSYEAYGLESCCLQHEIDHLRGILMINRISEFARSKALKAVHRFKKTRSGQRR
jgi:peptide deformylase